MATPGPTQMVTRPGRSAWRDAVVALTAIVLVATAIRHMFFVVPEYRRFLEGMNVVASAPARLAIGVSHFGLELVVICLATVGIACWPGRQSRFGRASAVLAVWGLLAAVYVALVTWVYADVGRVMQLVR